MSIHVNADGSLRPTEANRYGTKHAKEWHEAEAEFRVEARAKIERGEARLMERSKGGKVREVEPAA